MDANLVLFHQVLNRIGVLADGRKVRQRQVRFGPSPLPTNGHQLVAVNGVVDGGGGSPGSLNGGSKLLNPKHTGHQSRYPSGNSRPVQVETLGLASRIDCMFGGRISRQVSISLEIKFCTRLVSSMCVR